MVQIQGLHVDTFEIFGIDQVVADIEFQSLEMSLHVPSSQITVRNLQSCSLLLNSISEALLRAKVIEEPLDIRDLQSGSLTLSLRERAVLISLGTLLAGLVQQGIFQVISPHLPGAQHPVTLNCQNCTVSISGTLNITESKGAKKYVNYPPLNNLAIRNPHSLIPEDSLLKFNLFSSENQLLIQSEILTGRPIRDIQH